MGWINVNDKIPRIDKKVLIFVERQDKKREMHVGKWNGKFWTIGNFFEWDIGKPLFWKKLPEPPK